MPLLTKKKYSFSSTGMGEDTFSVVSFKGFEAVSKPYQFEILLVSEKEDTDPLDVLENPAVFTIHRDGEDDVVFNGVLIQFEETQEFSGWLFYKAVLAPKLWWLSLTHHNQVFLNQSVPDIMESALKDGGLNPGVDYAFNLMKEYPALEYVCQYDESHFDFISRWAEREGIYYFFEQGPLGEKVVFTDSKMEHKDLSQQKDLVYLPESGLDSMHTKEVVQAFICRHNILPQKVFLKDYNYLKPSLAVEGTADVDKNGRGEKYIYGVNFDSPEEGNRLAGIRAESLLCQKSIFHGQSAIPFMAPGYTFDMKDHYKGAYNRKYLITEVIHEGHQTGYLTSGLRPCVEKHDQQMFYSNTFKSIYADQQFRAQFLSPKPGISGTINAKIDAESSGTHAELDEHGRYKVILPFDRSGRSNGKASAWIRMMQPSAGLNRGMHFPLHKGTEVLLTFIDGNPDRPVIAGAVPNTETASPVNSLNQTKSVIQSGRGPKKGTDGDSGINSHVNNYISFNDAQNSENIVIHSKDPGTWSAWSRHGKNADDPGDNQAATSNTDNKPGTEKTVNTAGLKFYTDEKITCQANNGDENRVVGRSIDIGRDTKQDSSYDMNDLLTTMDNFAPANVYGFDEQDLLTGSSENPPSGFPENYEVQPVPDPMDTFKTWYENAFRTQIETRYDSDGYPYDVEVPYYLKDEYDGDVNGAWREQWQRWLIIRKQNSLSQKTCGKDPVSYYGQDYHTKDGEYQTNDVVGPWYNYLDGKWNTWLQERRAAWKKWQPHVQIARTTVSHRDTFNMQEGNIFDFGGYWNYNLGNCYVEEHLDQHATLNETLGEDLLDAGGPNWKKVDWTKAQDPAAAEGPSKSDIRIGNDYLWDNSAGSTNVWVNKSFGNAYNYSQGKTIEVSKGDSLSIQHGGHHVDMAFRGSGTIKSWSRSGGGISEEKKWTSKGNLLSKTHSQSSSGITTEYKYCRDTGAMLSYSSKHQGFNSAHSFDFNWANTAEAAFKFAAGTSFDFKMSANLDLAVYAGLNVDLSSYLAAKIDLSVYAAIKIALELSATLSIEGKIGTGVAIELDARNTGKIEYDGPSGKFKVKAGSMLEAEKAPSLKAAIDTLRARM